MIPTQIEVQPDVANQLVALAQARKISLDTLLRELLRQAAKPTKPAPRWRLAGSMELLDEDLASGSREISRSLHESLLNTAKNL